jgi:hypothetical protein
MTEKMRLLIKQEFFKNVTMQNEVNKNSENNIRRVFFMTHI